MRKILAFQFCLRKQVRYLNSFYHKKTALKFQFQPHLPLFSSNCYFFSTTKDNFESISPQKLTMQILSANTLTQLKTIYECYNKEMNFIHRNALLSKISNGPFSKEPLFTQQVIRNIKLKWNQNKSNNFLKTNASTIANTISYMSRGKFHHLDEEFVQINYNQLIRHLTTKHIVIVITGLLKLNLIDKIIQYRQKGNFFKTQQKFILQDLILKNVNGDSFSPGLLVSLWSNLLKHGKSTLKLNDFFAEALKTKNFKDNLIDYTHMLYCYVNSMKQRTVQCTYPILTYPVKNQKKLTPPELSIIYQQLADFKKSNTIYFPQSFTQLLKNQYLRLIKLKNIPLRNVANIFSNLILFQTPTPSVLYQTFQAYKQILKHEIYKIQKFNAKNMIRFNVDALSFSSLFNQLLYFYHPNHNDFLTDLILISFKYIETILTQPIIMKEYSDKMFLHLIYGLQQAKRKTLEENSQVILVLKDQLKTKVQEEILQRKFQQPNLLGPLMLYVNFLEIKSKQLCHKFKSTIEKMKKNVQRSHQNTQFNYQERLKQSCILSKNGKNCLNCFK